ncbi:MAG: hypothetical protein AAFZ91_08950 [Pseudomonadota bacterium]
MKRPIRQLKPFPFESDFSSPSPEPEDKVTMSALELQSLLAETRDGTASLIRDETLAAEADRLEKVSGDLKAALATIIELANLLDSAALDEEDKSLALSKVRRLAATLIEGQGDLFSDSASHSPLSNHSD